ncbi:molybdenum cofactor biosynthesis protein 1 isoform X2 [Helicoverpa armigera]|uniref:molybdenum cofactor biosynthesis protein 1 isoform X2 n=1 Tax=Helicoverpa armigera TaxID=29058 RepID=UPI003083C426
MKYINNLFFSVKRVNNSEVSLLGLFTRVRLVDSFKRSYSNEAGSAASAPAETPVPPLVDSFGRRHNYLRISLTERCNLRCQYCMPAEGVPLSARGALLSRAELVRLARVFVAAGVDKVRLTGGEPTLRSDLADVVRELREQAGVRSVALTTNGLVLTRRLPALQRAGLAALNVSLDSLRADRYERMARRPVHRVHAVLGQQVGRLEAGAVPRRAEGRRRAARARARSAAPQRHCHRVARAGLPRQRRLHLVHDAALLLFLQPSATHRGRKLKGVPVRRERGVAAGQRARRRVGRAAAGARARRAAQQARQACRHGESGPNGESTDDPHRRLAAPQSWTVTARSGGPPARQSAGLAWAPRREPRRAACRAYCSAPADDDGDGAFSHLDAQGRARMVDVGGKPVTARAALAECRLHVGGRLLRLLRDARLPKGDALTVAQLAGALGAKRTAELIPLCHPLALDVVRVRVALPPGECAAGGAITLRCEARATGRTGVEMEALTGCAVAALALYDMCKSVDRDMRISELRVLRKTGGRSDAAPAEPPAPLRKPRAPDAGDETYAPTNFMHF